jgi:2',5'-phosphodiesterase
MVMTIHVDLAARYVQRLCSSNGGKSIPYILAGDWNIKPDSSSYRLLTTGQMDRGDPDWPTSKFGVEWEPTAKPMRSAYAVCDPEGKEPDFTNYARIKEQEPFIETLDYIFVSPEWKVKNVKSIKSRVEAGGPFPNLDRNEPSDHVLIAAELEL